MKATDHPPAIYEFRAVAVISSELVEQETSDITVAENGECTLRGRSGLGHSRQHPLPGRQSTGRISSARRNLLLAAAFYSGGHSASAYVAMRQEPGDSWRVDT